MNKDDFLKCLPDSDDLRSLMDDCYNDDYRCVDYKDFQIAISDFVKGQIENLEYEKKMKEKK